jgi:hypothetical protein
LFLKFTLKLKSILNKSNKVLIKLMLKLSLINKKAIRELLDFVKEMHLIE